ncbi:MAG: hypothetical protein V4534_06280 [Myxococcota bacterium]
MIRSKLLMIALICCNPIFAQRLDLSPGVMTAGGQAMLKYHSDDIASWSGSNISLGIATTWGFFVIKDLAVVFDLNLTGQLSSGFDKNRRYQFGSGALYAIETDTNLRPYFQLLAHGAYVESGWSWGFSPSLGLLVGLSEQVALDFGINSRFDFAISRQGTTQIDMGAGYVGIRAFF